jgi:hypothetical protein
MVPSPRRLLWGAILIPALVGCGSASLPRDVVRFDVGRGSRGDIELVIPETLIRHGYAIQQRRDTGTLLYYETAWLNREPFEDEVEQCALECRTRIIVEARRQGGDIYSVTQRAENTFLEAPSMASSTGEPVWNPLPPTEKFREHIGQITEGISMRIDAGVRVFRPS